jgi:hypothetical protein
MFERESPVFADMFSFPAGSLKEPEGNKDTSPVRLEQVKTVDFERLLGLLYPL